LRRSRRFDISAPMFRRVWAVGLGLAIALLVACGDAPSPRAPRPSATFGALDRIPADTPYVIGLVEPLPPALFERYDAAVLTMLEAMKATPEANALTRAYQDELRGGVLAWLERSGVGPRLRYVVYGAPLLPVLRAEVASTSRVKDTIVRLLTAAKIPFQATTIGKHPALTIPSDGWSIVVAFPSETELVGAYAPEREAVERMEQLLTATPRTSLAASGRLRALARDGRRQLQIVGFADLPRLLDGIGLAEPCGGEAHDLAALMPTVELSSTWGSDGWFDMRMRAVVDPAIAAALGELRVEMPGLELPPKGDPIGILGAGLDLESLDALVKRAAAAVRARPFRCPQLAALNDLAVTLAGGFVDRLPPLLTALRGAVLRVDRLEPPASPGGPMRVVGHALLVHDDPGALLDLVDREAPPLAGAHPVDGGPPIHRSLATFAQPGLDEAALAVQGSLLAIAIGEDDAAVTALVHGAPSTGAPVAVVGVDMKRYMGLLATFQSSDPASKMLSMFDGFGFAAYALYLDERGVTLRVMMQVR